MQHIAKRKQAEEEVRNTAAQWQATFDAVQDHVLLLDKDFRILRANRAAAEFLKLPSGKIVGEPCHDLFHGTPMPPAECPLAKVRRSRRHEEAEVPAGQKGPWFSVSVDPVFDSGGELTHVVHVARDITERKRVEEERRESAERFRAIADYTYDWENWVGVDGKLLWVNPAVERMTGYSVAECMVMPDFPIPIVVEADREAFAGHMREAAQGSSGNDIEFRVRHKDGRLVWVAASWQPIQDSQGTSLGHRASMRDITDRKRAEDAVRQSEAYLAEAQRLSHTGSFAFDVASDKYFYISEECFRIFELDPQEGFPSREVVSRLIHPEDWGSVQADFENLLREKANALSEFRIVLPSGAVKHLEVIRHAVLNDAGEAVTIVGTTVDVTERKRAEEALRRSTAYLAEAQRLTHTGSYAYDGRTDTFPYWSEEQFRIWGFDPQQGPPDGKTLLERVHPDDRDRVLERSMMSLRDCSDYTTEYRIVLPDGTIKYIEAIGHHVPTARGGPIEVIGTHVDITERKRAEQERERLRQLEADLAHINRVSVMGELAASIAHEVNQPISGVVSNGSACLRWLDRDLPDLEEAREAVRRIIRDGKRAGEVITRIRNLTKKAEIPREMLAMNQMIREVLALAGDEAKRKNVIVRTEFADDLSAVSGDRVQLQQVLLNLVMNAIEAMSKIGERARELVISTRNTDADQVQVTVEDSGISLDPNTISKIFEPFYTTKPGGMGMGLSVSRSILESHGGRLWAAARDGQGTVFHFTLPNYKKEDSHARTAAV